MSAYDIYQAVMLSACGILASTMFVTWVFISIKEERGYTPRRRKYRNRKANRYA